MRVVDHLCSRGSSAVLSISPGLAFRQLTSSTFGVRSNRGTSRDDAPRRAPSSLRAQSAYVCTRKTGVLLPNYYNQASKEGRLYVCRRSARGAARRRLRRRRPGFGSASWELDPAEERTVKEQPDTGRSARRSQIESLKDDTYILCSGPSIGNMKRLPWQGDLLRRPARCPMDGRARP